MFGRAHFLLWQFGRSCFTDSLVWQYLYCLLANQLFKPPVLRIQILIWSSDLPAIRFLFLSFAKGLKNCQKYTMADTVTRTFSITIYLLFTFCLLSLKVMKSLFMDLTFLEEHTWLFALQLGSLHYRKWFPLVILVQIPSLLKGQQPKER